MSKQYESIPAFGQTESKLIFTGTLATFIILTLVGLTAGGYFYLKSLNNTSDPPADPTPGLNQKTTSNLGEDARLIPYKKGGKFGFCDKDKTLVIEPKYDYVEPFSDDLALVNIGMKINEKGEIIEIGTYGFIDATGKEIVPLKYKYATSFSEGRAFVSSNSSFVKIDGQNYGDNPTYLIPENQRGGMFIDNQGNTIFRVEYDRVGSFHGGLCKAVNRLPKKSGFYKMGFVDKTGKEVVPLIYGYVGDFSEGLALVSIDLKDTNKTGYIDNSGKVVIPLKFTSRYGDFADGIAKQRNAEGFVLINKSGEEVFKPSWNGYEEIYEYSEGLAGAVKVGGRRSGFIDKEGKEIISFIYTWTSGFHQGLARVSMGGKSGYINKEGKEVIALKYDLAAREFTNGLALVRLGNNLFYLDKNGVEFYDH